MIISKRILCMCISLYSLPTISMSYVISFLEAVQEFDQNRRNNYLINAVKKNNTEGVDAALQNGAAINGKAPDGKTALIYAIEKGNVELTKILLNYEADCNQPVSAEASRCAGMVPLMFVLDKIDMLKEQDPYRDILGLLLYKKLNLNAKDVQGRTLAFWCKKHPTLLKDIEKIKKTERSNLHKIRRIKRNRSGNCRIQTFGTSGHRQC
jgi:ankyrin repeat protein